MKKVRFLKKSSTNVMSIGDIPVVVDFKPGVTLITGENLDEPGRRNAVGKSTILDAFSICLFGEPVRNLPKSVISNYITKKNGEVVVDFEIEDAAVTTRYQVRRGVKKSFVKLFVNGEEKTLDTIANTDAEICRILGGNLNFFKNCLVMNPSVFTPFMRKDAKSKREFVEGVFNLEIFRLLSIRIKEEYSEAKSLVNATVAGITESNSNLAFIRKNKDDAVSTNARIASERSAAEISYKNALGDIALKNTKADYLEKEIRNKSDEKRKTIRDFNASLEEKKLEIIAEYDKKIIEAVERNNEIDAAIAIVESSHLIDVAKTNELLSAIVLPTEEEIQVIQTRIDTASRRKDRFESALTEAKTNIESNNKQILKLKEKRDVFVKSLESKEGATCPSCGTPLSQHSEVKVRTHIAVFDKEITDLETTTSETLPAIDVATEAIKTAEDIIAKAKGELDAANEEIRKERVVQKKLRSIADARTENLSKFRKENVDSIETAKYKALSALTRKDTADIDKEEAAAISGIIRYLTSDVDAEYETALSRITKEINIAHFVELISQISQTVSDKEAVLLAQRERLDMIETAKFVVSDEGAKAFFIRKILDALNERIQYFIARQGSRLRCILDENLEETIISVSGETCTYYNLSGAETKVIDLACMFAFHSIKSTYGNVSYNIMFMDEILDSAVDGSGVNVLLDVVKEVCTVNQLNTIIISHNKNIVGVFDDVINLQKFKNLTTRV